MQTLLNVWRHSDEKFMIWAENDDKVSKMQNALMSYPDLVNIKNQVNRIFYVKNFRC